MTAIVGVLNSQGIAIAADSAVTVTAANLKKVYNRSNKLFTLSKYHPVGIAIYNSATFMGIPWETLIKMYRKQLKAKGFDTVEKYKIDFISFLGKNLNFISPEFSENNFYSFCSIPYGELKAKILATLDAQEAMIAGLDPQAANNFIAPLISSDLTAYKEYINTLPKNSLVSFSLADFKAKHAALLDGVAKTLLQDINEKHSVYTFTTADIDVIKEIFYLTIKVEHIFEHASGLVFMGFGEKEVYPSSHLVTVGSVVNNIIRYKTEPPIAISPGSLDAEIIPYAQRDVTMTVLTGIDPAYDNEVTSSITGALKTISEEVKTKIADPGEANKISDIIDNTAKTLVQKLEDYRNNTITLPLISILNHMGKEDMAELAESLVSITSLKRKFTSNSSDESVGGPVDVAVITKGDGFIWLKRKHYFDTDLNKGFVDKYYKE